MNPLKTDSEVPLALSAADEHSIQALITSDLENAERLRATFEELRPTLKNPFSRFRHKPGQRDFIPTSWRGHRRSG
jgi:hypothetical protein